MLVGMLTDLTFLEHSTILEYNMDTYSKKLKLRFNMILQFHFLKSIPSTHTSILKGTCIPLLIIALLTVAFTERNRTKVHKCLGDRWISLPEKISYFQEISYNWEKNFKAWNFSGRSKDYIEYWVPNFITL